MGVHQATQNLQMNSPRDTATSDKSHISSSQTPEYKSLSNCDINTNCDLKNEINHSLEVLNNNNTNSQNCESPSIRNRTQNPKRERRPDRAVYVPRHRRLNLSPAAVNDSTLQSTNSNIENDKPVSVSTPPSFRTAVQVTTNEAESIQQLTKRNSQLCDIELSKKINSTNSNNISNILSSNIYNNSCKCNNSNSCNNSNICKSSKINDQKSIENSTPPIVTDRNQTSPKQNVRIEQTTHEHKHQQRFEELDNFKMNRKESSVKCLPQEMNHKDTKVFKPILACQLINETNSIKSHTKTKKAYDKEIDDWDALYDENGDCVDPNLNLSELTISVDKSPPNERQKIENGRHTRTISSEEFPHVLEVSNFPVEFKTPDLMMLFTSYKSSGFDIKWVDDTHALAIFSSSKIAAEVLSMNHPFVSLKPLPDATMASRNKARKCAELLQPYRQRPETCVALARRLVTGALGVKLKTSKEELENERRILQNAKEKRILAAKLRDEVWEDC